MSVINQMLRDLDQRGKPLAASAEGADLHDGTRSVGAVPAPPRRTTSTHRGARTGLWTLAVLVGASALAWQFGWVAVPFDESPAKAVPPVVASTAPVQVPASAPVAIAPLPLEPVAAVPAQASSAELAALQALDVPMSLRLDAQLDHMPQAPVVPKPQAPAETAASPRSQVSTKEKPPVPAVVAKREVAAEKAPPAPSETKHSAAAVTVASAEKTPHSAPAAPPTAARAPAAAVPDPAAAMQRQVTATREALTQAQGLWSLGNQTGAVDLLRDAVQSAEKAVQQPGMDTTLVALVRELARMQLAMGRVAEAHDLLVHFESRMKGIPEAWALRANAAQRLGQHQDSVQSYMQALQVRPTEQRWLLGLAVSLAAMGQTTAANEVVERARNEGPINRDIAAYLRQMGVVVR